MGPERLSESFEWQQLKWVNDVVNSLSLPGRACICLASLLSYQHDQRWCLILTTLSLRFAFASFPFLGQVLKGPHNMNEQRGVGGLDGRLR